MSDVTATRRLNQPLPQPTLAQAKLTKIAHQTPLALCDGNLPRDVPGIGDDRGERVDQTEERHWYSPCVLLDRPTDVKCGPW